MGEGGRRRANDLAVVVPVMGCLLLMPPLVGLFARTGSTTSAMPPVAVYLFGVWFALIACAFALSRMLRRTTETEDA